MKLIKIVLILLAAACAHADIEPIFFYWTATGAPHYDAVFEYGGGTFSGGVFTPTGLMSYSIGTPFGIYTQINHDSVFRFETDTPYGPSFNLQGQIEPTLFSANPFDPGYQEFYGNSFALYFQGTTEEVSYFQNGQNHGQILTGTWIEVIPDAANSSLLLAIGLGALGVFHRFRRPRAT